MRDSVTLGGRPPLGGDARRRWRRVSEILDRVLEAAEDERGRLLDGACGDDAGLRAEVEALLAADADPPADDFLAAPACDHVPELMPEELGPLRDEIDPTLAIADPLLGRALGPYRVVRRLGAGGMGVVYEGLDERLGRRVALKLLSADWSRDPVARRRLEREARAASALDHPNVCALYDLGESDDGRLYLVLAYYDGDTLDRRLQRGPLPIPEVRDLALQLARGLDHAHRAGVVHRDVKPANLLLTPAGELRILDFGVARTAEATDLTRTGSSFGTPAYMAPEQVRGETADRRCDLWALGVLVYEMLTGRRPFRGERAHAVLHSILHDEPPPVRTLRPEAPDDLCRLVEHALRKDPERRVSTAADVLVALDADPGPPAAGSTFTGPTLTASTLTGPTLADRPAPTVGEGDAGASAAAPSRRPLLRHLALALSLVAALALLAAWTLTRGAGDAELPAADAVAPGGPRIAAETYATPVVAYRRGRELLTQGYRRGYPQAAAELFQAALRMDDGYAPARAGLAEAYLWSFGEDRDPLWLDRAREQAELAVRADPQLAAARVALGTVLLVRREADGAVAELRRAVELDPLSADAHRELASALANAGSRGEAVRELQRALELAPRDWRTWERRGLVALRAGDAAGAEAQLRRATELAPDNPGVFKNLSSALIRQGRWEEAAAALQSALEIQPLASTYTNLGTLQFYLGRYEASRDSFERAIDLGANRYLHWANLADAYRWTDRPEQAAEAYRRAVQLLRRELEAAPDDPALRSRLALYLAKAGDATGALAQLERLPDGAKEADAAYRRAVVLELAGRRGEALAALEAAFEGGYPLDEARRDPELLELRRDPRYHRLAARWDEAGGEAAGTRAGDQPPPAGNTPPPSSGG